MSPQQPMLFPMPTIYEEAWEGMPEYQHTTLAEQKIVVSFTCFEDVQAFARLIGQPLTRKTRGVWFPPRRLPRRGDFFTEDDEA